MTDKIKYRRGVILARIEGTYGTDPFSGTPAFGSGYELYVENWESDIEYEPIAREGLQPHRQQLKPAQGNGTFPLKFDVEVSPATIEDGNSRPKIDPILQACGLVATASVGGDPKTITYKDKDSPQASCTIIAILYNESADDGIMVIYTGCRFDWTLKMASRERWMLSVSGFAAYGAESDIGAGPSGSIAYLLPKPLVGGGASCTISEVDADTSYSLDVVSLEVRGNNAPVERLALSGVQGIAEIAIPGGGHLQATLAIRATSRATFNPASYQKEVTALSVAVAQPNPATAGNYCQVSFLSVIRTRPIAEDNQLANWNLALDLISPEATSDGGGLVPVNGVFTWVFGTKAA